MSILNQMATRAKREGVCTLEWARLRNVIPNEVCLRGIPGRSELQKLRAWAERQGLRMDFDLNFKSFISEISSVTFRDPAYKHGHANAGAYDVEEPLSR